MMTIHFIAPIQLTNRHHKNKFAIIPKLKPATLLCGPLLLFGALGDIRCASKHGSWIFCFAQAGISHPMVCPPVDCLLIDRIIYLLISSMPYVVRIDIAQPSTCLHTLWMLNHSIIVVSCCGEGREKRNK